jgi:hypothetical protein
MQVNPFHWDSNLFEEVYNVTILIKIILSLGNSMKVYSPCLIFLFIHLFICAYIAWAISPPCSLLPPFLHPTPVLPGRTFSNFVEE